MPALKTRSHAAHKTSTSEFCSTRSMSVSDKSSSLIEEHKP